MPTHPSYETPRASIAGRFPSPPKTLAQEASRQPMGIGFLPFRAEIGGLSGEGLTN